MNIIPDKVKKYISYYNKIKENEIKSSLYTNTESESSFAIHESDSEIIFCFFISKKSFKYIKEYLAYKDTIKKNEIESSAEAFEKTVNVLKPDKFLEYCLDKKLNNPFRNFKLKGFIDCPNEFDRKCYCDFFFHKIKFYMHSGFIKLYNTIAPELLKQINYYMTNYPNKKIIFIGFSFSSILAQLAYLVYFLKFPTKLDNVECYLYSTPNIGNKKYQKFFETLHQKSKNRRLYVVNCDNDVVHNMFSKRFGFHFMKSVILIKRNTDTKKVYTSKEYERIIENLS